MGLAGTLMNTWIAKTLVISAVLCFANAAWIPAKASLAQHMLQSSWKRTLAGEEEVKPWPGADYWPVARLSAPELGVDLIVLSGDLGRTLILGPGHVAGSASPGLHSTSISGGHRDTHFNFLGDLDPSDRLLLETPDGNYWYQVSDIQIVDSRDTELTTDIDDTQLTLVTCYPLDAVDPGGPLRLVVTAEPLAAMASL